MLLPGAPAACDYYYSRIVRPLSGRPASSQQGPVRAPTRWHRPPDLMTQRIMRGSAAHGPISCAPGVGLLRVVGRAFCCARVNPSRRYGERNGS